MVKTNETNSKQPDNEVNNSHNSNASEETIDNLRIEKLEQKLIESERKSLGLFELTNDAIFLLLLSGI